MIPPFNESPAQHYHEKFMPTFTAKSIWKFGLLAEEKGIKEDNSVLRYLIINKLVDVNMRYKYGVCPFEKGNYSIVKINYIENDEEANIEIDMGRLDVIPYDDNDGMVGCKCNKCKQWKIINKV